MLLKIAPQGSMPMLQESNIGYNFLKYSMQIHWCSAHVCVHWCSAHVCVHWCLGHNFMSREGGIVVGITLVWKHVWALII